MSFSYKKSRVVQLINPCSTLCLNKIVSHSHQYLVEKAINPMNATSYIYGLKHINSSSLLLGGLGCGRRFYNANRYPQQVYTPRPLQVYIPTKKSILSWWQWLRNREYSFTEIFVTFNILLTSFERIPYSNRIHMVTYSDKLERLLGQRDWKKSMEKEYKGKILPPTHPQSVRVQSILREIVQGMHNGLVLNPKSERYGSEATLLVERPKKSIIKLGTRHLEGLNWEVKVVKSYRYNAEYHRNGKIVIYTGMLHWLDSDAELAYVLGHEVGHAVARHSSEIWMRLLWMIPPLWALKRLLIFPFLIDPVNKYISRRRELEADYIGLMLMASAGYDPRVAPKHYMRFHNLEENLLSTHPSDGRRARSLKENKVMGEALAIYKGVTSGHGVKRIV